LLLIPATLIFAGCNQERAMKHSIVKLGLPLLAALAARQPPGRLIKI